MYTKNNCGYCARAKHLLDARDIDYKEVNVEDDLDAKDFIVSKGHRTLPQFYTSSGELLVEGGYEGLVKMSKEEILEKENA